MIGRSFREISLAVALVLWLGCLAWVAPAFYQPQPLLSLLSREAPTLVVACGMAMVMVSRQIDISVGSQFALCGVFSGWLASQQISVGGALSGSLILGGLLGGLNGLLVAGLRLPSIVVTLATLVSWREGLRVVQQGKFVNLPEGFQWFGLSQSTGQWTLVGLALGVLIVGAVLARHLAAGRAFYAVGSDAEAARLAGLRPSWVTFRAFLLLGVLTGLAAWMNTVQSPQVDPKAGTGLELKVIAAAVVGGVAVSGGRGSLWGVLLGLLLLASINPALTHLRVEAYWEKAIQGAIILLAVTADAWRSRKLGGTS